MQVFAFFFNEMHLLFVILLFKWIFQLTIFSLSMNSSKVDELILSSSHFAAAIRLWNASANSFFFNLMFICKFDILFGSSFFYLLFSMRFPSVFVLWYLSFFYGDNNSNMTLCETWSNSHSVCCQLWYRLLFFSVLVVWWAGRFIKGRWRYVTRRIPSFGLAPFYHVHCSSASAISFFALS